MLADLCIRSGAKTTLDMFTGTTRIAKEFKRSGTYVTAVDTARYSSVFANCHIGIDRDEVDLEALESALYYLEQKPGYSGYFTEVFCNKSHFFQPFNGEKIDAIRDAIRDEFTGTPIHDILLTSLIYAADRVDSTVGLQMAYIKKWAPRSYKPLELKVPELLPGKGRVVKADACEVAGELGEVDLAYLDPPYNQHRYYTNYHIWETLVAWDNPDCYGVACKRVDSRDDSSKSVFNKAGEMPQALAHVISALKTKIIILSYNNEAWISLEDLISMCDVIGYVEVLAFDSKRYVGAQIGIHDPKGNKVGSVSHLRNLEYLVIAGDRDTVKHMTLPYGEHKLDLALC